MPRYFFHVADGAYIPDTEGTEFPNETAARANAVVYMGEVLKQEPGLLSRTGAFRVEVTDEAGSLRYSLVTVAVTPIQLASEKKLPALRVV